MQCPRCESTSLTEMDRDGVTIDRCDRCRGIWLDRGELEKLVAYARDERGGRPGGDDDDDDDDTDDRSRTSRRRDLDDDDDDDRRDRGGRRRSWWEIFD